jgi:hypothetical protein
MRGRATQGHVGGNSHGESFRLATDAAQEGPWRSPTAGGERACGMAGAASRGPRWWQPVSECSVVCLLVVVPRFCIKWKLSRSRTAEPQTMPGGELHKHCTGRVYRAESIGKPSHLRARPTRLRPPEIVTSPAAQQPTGVSEAGDAAERPPRPQTACSPTSGYCAPQQSRPSSSIDA